MTSNAPFWLQSLRKVRFKKKLNQDNYSCQAIINHLTQRLGVGREEPHTCGSHRWKTLSNATQGVGTNTRTRTRSPASHLPARAPSKARGLGWGETETSSCSLSGVCLLHQNISSVTAQTTSVLLTVGSPVPGFVRVFDS